MCDTIWSAVGAIASFIGALAIVFAAIQLYFNVWLKAQQVWVSSEFTADRKKIFARLDTSPTNAAAKQAISRQ